MGFLDKSQDVIDMVLTGVGQKLLSQGKLRFVYWMPFDDEVDYDPYVAASGSMTVAEVSSSKMLQTENGVVREAVSGYKDINPFHLDRTNVYRPLFTIPQGQTVVPKIVKVHRTGSATIDLKMQKNVDWYSKKDHRGDKVSDEYVDRGFSHFESSRKDFEYRYTPNSFPGEHPLEGFKIRVFSSGSSGLVEIHPKHDSNDEVAFKSDLKLIPLQPKVLKRGIKIR